MSILKEKILENAITFYNLEWDTDFFGVTSAKVILKKPLTLTEWRELKDRFQLYEFISIENRDSEPVNANIIGQDTAAFLADVNIQFTKKLKGPSNEMQKNITIHQGLKRVNQVLDIVDFQFSKFTADAQFALRGGDQVYHQWIINSFEKQNKYFLLSNDDNGDINGFLLHSYTDSACVIELLSVSQALTNGGVGTSLFKAVEYAAYQHGFNEIRVGTQLRNIGAINFYHKVGCKQVGCHQVYHLWNL